MRRWCQLFHDPDPKLMEQTATTQGVTTTYRCRTCLCEWDVFTPTPQEATPRPLWGWGFDRKPLNAPEHEAT